MATTLRDFIAQRETEIRDQQKALKAELRELQIAKAALEGPTDAPTVGVATLTIKEMARDVLSGMPGGLNSSGILDAIKKKYSREIERTSLSPQLSRLKDDGELVLDGDTWFTAEHHAAETERRRAELSRLVAENADNAPGRQAAMTGQRNPFAEDFEDDVPF
ncbi:MAG TPA: hypothetical protein VLG14_02630 [Sphingomonas sp.]|nr:hypothetical protein [Sphingomonas sp.]